MSDARDDELVNRAIARAIRGGKSWPLNRKYPVNCSDKDRFEAGDNQMLLWAIENAANRMYVVSIVGLSWIAAFRFTQQ